MARKSQVKRLASSLRRCFNICKTEQQASESLPETEETCEDGNLSHLLCFVIVKLVDSLRMLLVNSVHVYF